MGELVQGTDGSFSVQVVANTHAHALALASILAPTESFGNVTVDVIVSSRKGGIVSAVTPSSAANLADLERAAFEGNHLLQKVVVSEVSPSLAEPRGSSRSSPGRSFSFPTTT